MLETVWTYPIHHAMGTFAMDGDDCFVAGCWTRLTALDAETGSVRWSVRIQSPWGWMAFNALTVFYLDRSAGSLSAFDRRTGQLMWSREFHAIYGWLHASQERVVVGGWRGYTDIVALDAKDGRTCWTRSARHLGFLGVHSTRIHAESGSLVIGEPPNKRIAFLRLTDGQTTGEYPFEAWAETFVEHPIGTTKPGCPAVIRSGEHGLLLIEGATPDVRTVEAPAAIWSHDLACIGSSVPFVTMTKEILVLDLVTNQTLSLGPIRSNWPYYLAFRQVSEGVYLVGTWSGVLRCLSPAGEQIAARKIGKRIETGIGLAGQVAVCGTASGEVVGVGVTMEG